MVKSFNKLVRDQIPAIIESEGRQCATETMNESEYLQALLQKLIEEAQEVATTSVDQRAIELADLYEVVDSILALEGLKESDVRHIQVERRAERGGFEKRIKLLWAD